MSDVKFKYDFLKYNKYEVLRPSLLLILILCFLCKDFFMVLIVGASVIRGRGGSGVSDLIALVSPAFIFADIPALGLFYAIGARRPEAGKIPRALWKYGRDMILGSVLLYTVILFSLRGHDVSAFSLLDWLVIALNGVIVAYVYSSHFIKDQFAEFPVSKNDTQKPKPV